MKIHWNILDNKRKAILPLFKTFSDEGFYLAGGTGLALLMGHRDSIDFDFFKKENYDTQQLINKLESVFEGHQLTITQQEKNTVSCVVDATIQLSFFSYNYDQLKPLVQTEYFKIASIEDIACMKLSAITSRAVEKDYVDLYYILHKNSLEELLNYCSTKFRSINEIVVLKSLNFWEDLDKQEPIKFKEGHKVTLKQMQKYIKDQLDNYFKEKQLKDIRKNNGKGLER